MPQWARQLSDRGLTGPDSHRNQRAVRMTHDRFGPFVASAYQSVGECLVKRPRLVRNFPKMNTPSFAADLNWLKGRSLHW